MVNLDLLNDLDNCWSVKCNTIESLESCKKINSFLIPNFKILTFNIRSINQNFDNFLIALYRLDITFDAIILTECWLKNNSPINLPGYNCHQTTKFINKASGTIVFTRCEWNVTICEPPLMDAEGLLISFPKNNITLLAIYRSPSNKDLTNFLTSLNTILTSQKTNPNLILSGDINIDILDPLDKSCDEYLCLMAEHDLVAAVTKPTRYNTCLDHFFIRSKSHFESIVCSNDITDHNLIMLSIKNNTNKVSPQKTRIKTDYEAVANEISTLDWSPVLDSNDTNEAAATLTSTICEIIKKHSRLVKTPNSKLILKPWITPGLVRCMKHRDKLHAKSRKKPDDAVAKLVYCRYRNFCNNLLKKVKSTYYNNELEKNKRHPKSLWNTVKSICDLPNNRTTATELLVTDPSLSASNAFFTSVGPTLAHSILSKLNKTQAQLAAEVQIPQTAHSFFMNPTDITEVIGIIRNLKSHSAPGFDGINNHILKLICIPLADPLTHVFNLSMASGIFPSCWKLASVTPIHKAGDKKCPNNYRPISLLSNLSKVLEKIVNTRVVSFLETNNILSPRQFGFRQGKSTEDAVSGMINILSSRLDGGGRCVGVFLDLAKAFDTVSIPILIEKLHRYGFRGPSLDWFQSYLTDRRQHVKVDNSSSDPGDLLFGVPQGSILGPILFILYINDIGTALTNQVNTEIFCYADDTALIFNDASWDSALKTTEKGMAAVTSWLNNNLLTLNANKTKYICFSKTKASAPKHSPPIKVHDPLCQSTTTCSCNYIERADNIKYLGVILDEHLNFTNHITSLSARARKLIHLMKRLRIINDKDLLGRLYIALCQSILTYCISCWGGASKTHLLLLERAQRSILKVTFNKPFRYPTTSLYQDCKVLSIRQLFIFKVIIYQYTEFIKSSSSIKLLSKRRVLVPVKAVNTAFAQRFKYFLGPFLFNKIFQTCALRHSQLNEAKIKIFKYLQSLDYESTEDLLLIKK